MAFATSSLVQARKETPSGFNTVKIHPDRVGIINPNLTIEEIKCALNDSCKYLRVYVRHRDPIVSTSYIQASFPTDDIEQLLYAMSMLVDRSVINFNPISSHGLLFGEHSHHE